MGTFPGVSEPLALVNITEKAGGDLCPSGIYLAMERQMQVSGAPRRLTLGDQPIQPLGCCALALSGGSSWTEAHLRCPRRAEFSQTLLTRVAWAPRRG